MTEGTPPPPDQPRPPGQQPPPYNQPFGQPAQPGQPAYSPPPSYEQPSYAQPNAQRNAQPAYGQQSAYGQPPGHAPHGARDPDRRPGTVVTACILTWIFAGIAAAMSALMLVIVNAERDDFVVEVERNDDFQELDMSGEQLVDLINVVGVPTLLLALVAIPLAVAAFRRSKGGRIALVVMSGITLLASLALILSCVSVVWLAAATAVIVLLFTGGANDWYARRGAAPGPTHNQPGDYGQWPQA